jgi:hypothetical protein
VFLQQDWWERGVISLVVVPEGRSVIRLSAARKKAAVLGLSFTVFILTYCAVLSLGSTETKLKAFFACSSSGG